MIHNPDVHGVRPLKNLLKLRVSRAPGFEAIVDNVLGPFRGGAVPAWALAMVASQMLGVYMMSNVLPRMIFAGAALSGVYLVSNLAMSLNLSIVSRGLI